MEELVDEMKSLKGGKCPDGAGIVAEMLKNPGLELRTCFLNLFNSILFSQAVPPQRWRHSTISVIFKNGDPQVAKNYRPISILSMTYKLFSRLLLRRVKPILEQAQAVDQAGFRAGFSCSDHLFCLAQIQEKAYEWRHEVWLVAIDFVKAFDTVDHERLFETLHLQKVPEVMVLYRGHSSKEMALL